MPKKSLMKRIEQQEKCGTSLGKFDLFEAGKRSIKRTVKKGKSQRLSMGTSPARILGTKRPKGKMYE